MRGVSSKETSTPYNTLSYNTTPDVCGPRPIPLGGQAHGHGRHRVHVPNRAGAHFVLSGSGGTGNGVRRLEPRVRFCSPPYHNIHARAHTHAHTQHSPPTTPTRTHTHIYAHIPYAHIPHTPLPYHQPICPMPWCPRRTFAVTKQSL